MAFPLYILLLLLFTFPLSFSKLTPDYYKESCPDFQRIVREIVTTKQISNPTTAAATLRTFFHDCMVDGCDASVLVSSNSFNHAERDADINLSLPGDAFDVVIRAKTALELSCPKTVSCSDILAQATRDLITMVGGPFYPVRLGRKDSLVSMSSRAEGQIPRTNMTVEAIIKLYATKGFTAREMVALMGGHTIGFSHCKEFVDRLYHYNKNTPTDPALNPKFAAALKAMCNNYKTDPTMSAFNDVYTPGKFDNMYFQNLVKGLGLLASDDALVRDPVTKPFVELYAKNQDQFFKDFSLAMEKLSVLGAKTGKKGEVRNRCDHFNMIHT
ncbi:hypothetical protein K2173_012976 [Erythroxylum novogranatense]|uniref:Peroxidase n=1 Tax=Erythroxylum novogranatense TaxID=1862640 RepID=A0AAV8S748_9ROSI|nr:hypothetical protein K2173_012976 [Erythroxylum novogranatense]